ncbi:MAG TPA: hypothetical protein EYO76_02625, partial [Flavobacteriaceae bacterium]|nr:hypothetical protein [Flavobacteriaceae bacterium]
AKAYGTLAATSRDAFEQVVMVKLTTSVNPEVAQELLRETFTTLAAMIAGASKIEARLRAGVLMLQSKHKLRMMAEVEEGKRTSTEEQLRVLQEKVEQLGQAKAGPAKPPTKTKDEADKQKWAPRCWICNQSGHLKRDCPDRLKADAKNGGKGSAT